MQITVKPKWHEFTVDAGAKAKLLAAGQYNRGTEAANTGSVYFAFGRKADGTHTYTDTDADYTYDQGWGANAGRWFLDNVKSSHQIVSEMRGLKLPSASGVRRRKCTVIAGRQVRRGRLREAAGRPGAVARRRGVEIGVLARREPCIFFAEDHESPGAVITGKSPEWNGAADKERGRRTDSVNSSPKRRPQRRGDAWDCAGSRRSR